MRALPAVLFLPGPIAATEFRLGQAEFFSSDSIDPRSVTRFPAPKPVEKLCQRIFAPRLLLSQMQGSA